jgi:hypothetical protein
VHGLPLVGTDGRRIGHLPARRPGQPSSPILAPSEALRRQNIAAQASVGRDGREARSPCSFGREGRTFGTGFPSSSTNI